MPADPNESASQALTPGNHKHNIKAHNEHLATIEGIVLQLKFLLIIEKRLIEYYSFSQVALVPKALVLQLISSVRMGLLDSGYVKEGEADQITLIHPANLQEDILRSSSSEVVITSNLEPGTFCALFCGANLRIETLGLLYTMAARSSIHATDYEEDEGQADGFIREMGWYGALSLRVARELAPQTTDVMAWLAHENLQLITVFEGDASMSSYP